MVSFKRTGQINGIGSVLTGNEATKFKGLLCELCCLLRPRISSSAQGGGAVEGGREGRRRGGRGSSGLGRRGCDGGDGFGSWSDQEEQPRGVRLRQVGALVRAALSRRRRLRRRGRFEAVFRRRHFQVRFRIRPSFLWLACVSRLSILDCYW